MRNTLINKALSATAAFGAALPLAGWLIVGAPVALTSTPAAAITLYCTNCATTYQQGMEYAKAVETALNTAQQLKTQINQYNELIKQGMKLPSSMFNNVNDQLQQVVYMYNDSKALGRNIAKLDSDFRQQFTGYDSYLQTSGNAGQSNPQRYKDWATQGYDNARTSMKAAGMNVSTFASEEAALQGLVGRSAGSVGQMQAIQAGNEISAQNVQQLQKLRDLLATQITQQGNFIAQQTDRQAVDDAFQEKFRTGAVGQTNRMKSY